ncbi:MAG: hypothetical protein QNJ97_09635 [Myxococcota bacterium]|nr:hypothetical protein [Myxococcota bacterium]
MNETKKLRRALPATLLRGDAAFEFPTKTSKKRAKRLDLTESVAKDSWADLLGEPEEPSKLYYEKGAWNFCDEPDPINELDETLVWKNVSRAALRKTARAIPHPKNDPYFKKAFPSEKK